MLLPEIDLNLNNRIFNEDANELIERIECDLLYLDPPYNSRQYSDAYHLLENVARWEKPEVFGVARKMDRSALKSDYCMSNATQAFEDLIDRQTLNIYYCPIIICRIKGMIGQMQRFLTLIFLEFWRKRERLKFFLRSIKVFQQENLIFKITRKDCFCV